MRDHDTLAGQGWNTEQQLSMTSRGKYRGNIQGRSREVEKAVIRSRMPGGSLLRWCDPVWFLAQGSHASGKLTWRGKAM